MLPAAELIRVVRVARANTEFEEGDVERGNLADAAKDKQKQTTKKKKKKKSASNAAHVVALDVSSFLPGAGAEALAASVALGGPFAAATREHPDAERAAVALASRGASFLETETLVGDGASLAAERADGAEREPGSPRRPPRLAGRAAYVCRRGHCARSVAKAKAFKRHLKVSPGGADAADARRFYDGLVGVCELAETLDGVDSSRWAFTREPGTPSRWEAHPVAVDQGSGEEVASERAKRLAVGGSGADGGAV
jgi:predicted RNA-binding protein YlxR (DUF448 family)